MPIIEPRMLGLLPDGVDKATFFVADKSNVERRIFDTDGELYTPDGQTIDNRLNAVEAGIPPLDDARIVALEGAMLTAQGDIIVAEADIVTAESDIDALEVTVGAEQLLLDQAQTDITNLQGEMVTAQSDIVTADGKAVAAQADADAHIANVANPHIVTRAQIGAEAIGTAASAIVTHVALADPHAQYLKESATASEVEALPLNDANNYFTGSTIGDQMQEAGAIIQPFADHVANVANPHTVTATQVGLGNVTNESKATMFTSPTFTGTPVAPTAVVGTDTTQVATTAFVNDSIDAVTASDVEIVDAGTYYATDNVEAALQSVGSQLGQIVTEKTSYGVVSGLGVTQQTVPDMTVRVATGVIWMEAGTRFAPTANNALAVTAADATNPRIDIVYVNSSGVISYLAGTAAASPAQPATPAGGQLLASILVTAGKTSILTADISNRRKSMWTEDMYAPTLSNSWVPFDAAKTPKYWKNQDAMVVLKGSVKSGTNGTEVLKFAAGYRPLTTLYFAMVNANTNAIVIVSIFNTGVLSIQTASNTHVSLDGIQFRAEQ